MHYSGKIGDHAHWRIMVGIFSSLVNQKRIILMVGILSVTELG